MLLKQMKTFVKSRPATPRYAAVFRQPYELCGIELAVKLLTAAVSLDPGGGNLLVKIPVVVNFAVQIGSFGERAELVVGH